MWNLKNKINEKTKGKRLIDIGNKVRAATGVWRAGEKGEGIKKYELVVAKQTRVCKVQHRKYSQ